MILSKKGIRIVLDDLVSQGDLREQCASCSCGKEYHDEDARRCNVCWDHCTYRPCWVIR